MLHIIMQKYLQAHSRETHDCETHENLCNAKEHRKLPISKVNMTRKFLNANCKPRAPNG